MNSTVALLFDTIDNYVAGMDVTECWEFNRQFGDAYYCYDECLEKINRMWDQAFAVSEFASDLGVDEEIVHLCKRVIFDCYRGACDMLYEMLPDVIDG